MIMAPGSSLLLAGLAAAAARQEEAPATRRFFGADGHGVRGAPKTGPAPAIGDHAAYARWMVRSLTWGTMSTLSTQEKIAGYPFGNPVSFADGGTGNPYMCVSPLDSSVKDLAANPKFSLTVSAAQNSDAPAACAPHGRGDPENPPCARLALTGDFQDLTGGPEFNTAVRALNASHPTLDSWGCFQAGGSGGSHGFFLAKMAVKQAWLINMYGGAAVVDAADYYAP